MPRPRVHDLDTVLDAAEQLAVVGGPSAVTVRAVSEATGMSNGAIYHGFTSRSGLVGRAWLRAAQRFLDMQRDAVDDILAGAQCRRPPGSEADDRSAAVEAVVAAADTPAAFAEKYPASARLLWDVRRDELLTADVPPDVADELRRLDSILVALFIRLATALWGRRDGRAVQVIEDCVVGLPTGLLLRGQRSPDVALRARLHAAVRAVLDLDPPMKHEV